MADIAYELLNSKYQYTFGFTRFLGFWKFQPSSINTRKAATPIRSSCFVIVEKT